MTTSPSTPTPVVSDAQDWRWKAVPDFPNYEVSDQGQVRNHVTGRVLKPFVNTKGAYLMVALYSETRRMPVRVSRLVLSTFIGPPNPGDHAAHLNGDVSDNRLANLTWATPQENERHKRAHGTACRGEKHGRARLTAANVHDIRERCRRGEAFKTLAAEYGVSPKAVKMAALGVTWSGDTPDDAHDWREKIAREVRLAMLDNPTGGTFESRSAERTLRAYDAADALLSGPIAEMQAEHQREVERIRTLYEEQLDHAHSLLSNPPGKEGE